MFKYIMEKFVLGTAQLGLNYGITNIVGKPTKDQSIEIIKYAIENNIKQFDTAREYGESENLLSHASNFNTTIITKLSKFSVNISQKEIVNHTINSIEKSCLNLKINTIDILLLHSYEQYKNKTIWKTLTELKKKNKINKLGVSVYTVSEAIDCLNDSLVEHIQIPFNLLDNQWDNIDFLNLINKRKNITIHVRSIFLQGILINNKQCWPKNVDSEIYINKIENLASKLNLSKIELCISYVKSMTWINGIIIGVETLEQLKNNIDLFINTRLLNSDEILLVQNIFNNIPNVVTDPRLWIK